MGFFSKKKEKVSDIEVARKFFEHPISIKLFEIIDALTDDEISMYISEILKPTIKLLKSIVIRAQFGGFTEEEAEKLFCTERAAKLRNRLLAMIKD